MVQDNSSVPEESEELVDQMVADRALTYGDNTPKGIVHRHTIMIRLIIYHVLFTW